ncbi:MAG: type II toxin-antitoxin system VapC family toxin [Candidatus Aenigmarchaeota archaeon]|nr:type II toxin-antitoxin system VapC family toxin [Candidatus Aenigmarchaeota archaeon]
MKKVLIDTDILIDFLRKSEPAKKIIEDVINENIIGLVSVITEAELLSGKECNKTEKKHLVEELLLLMNKLEVGSAIAKKAGELRRTHNTPLVDSLIAASAIISNSVLYTRNIRHFQKIKGLKFVAPY